MHVLNSPRSWLAAPVLWFSGVVALLLVWALNYPCPESWIQCYFDNDGCSFVEAVTIGFFFLQIAFIWLFPPMAKGMRRVFWQVVFSLITLIAICRELDWHKAMIDVSAIPGATTGTPFKMRFLTNPANPLGDRLLVLSCFVLVIALCGGTLLYFIRKLWKGLFKLHPVCWSIAFLGGTCILVQIVDRAPSVLRKKFGILLSGPAQSLLSVLEEGQELLLPLFVMLALVQAYFLYGEDEAQSASSGGK